MSEVHDCGVNFGKHYSLPGVEPSRALAATFSAQRYDPLHLPPILLLGNGAREQTFRGVQEMVVAHVPLRRLALPCRQISRVRIMMLVLTEGERHGCRRYTTRTKMLENVSAWSGGALPLVYLLQGP